MKVISGQQLQHHAVLPMTTQDEMHSTVVELYSFHPTQLSESERERKSGAMDDFWAAVKLEPASRLPLLRKELQRKDVPPFFEMDGASLLLSLSNREDDRQIALSAMSHCDLADVNPHDYFFQVHAQSIAGANTADAALHILDRADYKVYVPQHALGLRREQALIYLLLPVDQTQWIDAATRKFEQGTEDQQLDLLALFYFAQTAECDALLRSATRRGGRVRDAALQWVKQEIVADGTAARMLGATIVRGDEKALRTRRRARLSAVSDEAVDDFLLMTARLVQLRHKEIMAEKN